MSEVKPVAYCSNLSCKWPIYKGDQVWRCGKKLFCHRDCLIEYMKNEMVVKV